MIHHVRFINLQLSKNLYKVFIFSLLSICFFTGCPIWCDISSADNLPNTDFYIASEKSSYSVNEELVLTFSSVPDFSTFDKYTFAIYLEEFDAVQNEYISANNFIFVDTNIESNEGSTSFGYEKKDIENTSKVIKTFSVKATAQGKFLAYIHGNGWHYNDKGGVSALGYDKWIYINVSE